MFILFDGTDAYCSLLRIFFEPVRWRQSLFSDHFIIRLGIFASFIAEIHSSYIPYHYYSRVCFHYFCQWRLYARQITELIFVISKKCAFKSYPETLKSELWNVLLGYHYSVWQQWHAPRTSMYLISRISWREWRKPALYGPSTTCSGFQTSISSQ